MRNRRTVPDQSHGVERYPPFQMKRRRKNKKEDTKRQQHSEQKRSFHKPHKDMAPLVGSTSIQICLNAGLGLVYATALVIMTFLLMHDFDRGHT